MSNKRAELRRQAKEKEKERKVYNLTNKDIQGLKDQITSKAIKDAYIVFIGAANLVLHDKNNFAKNTRLPKFDRDMMELFNMIDEGRLTMDDIIELNAKELGCHIEVEKQDNESIGLLMYWDDHKKKK